MTLAVDNRTENYPGSGTSGPFTYNFSVETTDELVVTKYDSSNNPTVLTLAASSPNATQYTNALSSGGAAGGSLTLGVDLEIGESLNIQGATPLSQGIPFGNQGAFFAEKHERAYDKLTRIVQEINRDTGRGISLSPLNDDDGINQVLPPLTASTALVVNSAGTGFEFSSFASLGDSIDTQLSGLANNDFLLYQTGTAQWENKTSAQVASILGVGSDALPKQGTDIASATTTDLGAANSNFVQITGTTTITSFGTTTDRNHIWIYFGGALTLTHNATSLILPGAADITTAAGDRCEAIRLGSGNGNWMIVNYQRASGLPLVSPSTTGYETGDGMWTFRSSARSGFLMCEGQSLGDTGSGADLEGSTYQDLYSFFWDNLANTEAPVSTGRGVSALADFVAGKTITIPDVRNQLPVGAGSTYTIGDTSGADEVTLAEANIPAHTHSAGSLVASSAGGHSHTTDFYDQTGASGPNGYYDVAYTVNASGTMVSAPTNSVADHTHTITGASGSVGSGTAFSIIPPVIGMKYMIKL